MKNILWILSASVVFTLSSCISTAQFNNAEDDVYYSPKASNSKKPVMIPEVNVDEIIKKNPPQYGQPTNRVDDVTPNPNAAEGYRSYRAQQDSLYKQDPSLSGYYIDPNLPNSESDEIARINNNRWFSGSYRSQNRWSYGLGWNSFYGPGISLGYGYTNWGNNWNYNYGCYPYNSWGYSPYYYNNWNSCNGWNSGFGFGNPYYNNYWGYPGYYGYGYGYYDNRNNTNSGSSTAGNKPISAPRPGVGGTTPPGNTNAGRSGQYSGGRNYVAPQPTDQAQPGANPNNGRTYTPTTGEQRLENNNGRIIYTRPQEVIQPVQTQTPPSPASAPPTNQYQRSDNNNGYSQPAPAIQRPSDSRGSYSAPPANNGGGGRSGSSGGGGNSGGTGGRRR
ncbi:MAG: hypothetical protein V4651_11440 [Bacteroidota bacterium]